MDSVGTISPFVPPEWIAAHGLRPAWLALDRQHGVLPEGAHRGLCPCAGALIIQAFNGTAADSLVLTTACDQMRYAAAYLDIHGSVPTFLLNVPSTWQSPQSRQLYRNELERLGRFLIDRGGRNPTAERLVATVERYDSRRAAARAARATMPADRWVKTLIALRSDPTLIGQGTVSPHSGNDSTSGPRAENVAPAPLRRPAGVPLALVGGPLLAGDERFLGLVARAGGHIILDASEGGERTLPAPIDRNRLAADPLDELVRVYFDTIPDVFRRPNTRLHDWLADQLAARGVRGIVFRRYLFCDLWNAELHRLRQESGLPVLAIDVNTGEESETARTLGRIEAFLEMLQ